MEPLRLLNCKMDQMVDDSPQNRNNAFSAAQRRNLIKDEDI